MKIDEVSKKFGLTKDTLRYYEKIELIKDVPKNGSGQRDYTPEVLEHITFIMCMRRAGLTLNQIKDYMELYERGDETHDERYQILEAQKEYVRLQILELEDTLAYLNHKTDIYDERKQQSKQ